MILHVFKLTRYMSTMVLVIEKFNLDINLHVNKGVRHLSFVSVVRKDIVSGLFYRPYNQEEHVMKTFPQR